MNILKLFLFIILVHACVGNNADQNISKERRIMEMEGQKCLHEARRSLSNKRYAEARSQILSMREQYPMAVSAREEAILLMDSIHLLEAIDDMGRLGRLMEKDSIKFDSLREEWQDAMQRKSFYERKLKNDQKVN